MFKLKDTMNTITCQTCGDLYDISHLKGRDRKNRLFCGKTCSSRFTNAVYPRRGAATILAVRGEDGQYLACIGCGIGIEGDRHLAFCTAQCREGFWSTLGDNRPTPNRVKNNLCPHCGVSIGDSSRTCQGCTYIDRIKERIQEWLDGTWSGALQNNEYLLSTTIKRYLLEQANYSCTECGFNTPHPDGSSILQVDHIDGHANNHSPENLKVLCPNCHALTGTFGNRNKGNGRPHKRLEW